MLQFFGYEMKKDEVLGLCKKLCAIYQEVLHAYPSLFTVRKKSSAATTSEALSRCDHEDDEDVENGQAIDSDKDEPKAASYNFHLGCHWNEVIEYFSIPSVFWCFSMERFHKYMRVILEKSNNKNISEWILREYLLLKSLNRCLTPALSSPSANLSGQSNGACYILNRQKPCERRDVQESTIMRELLEFYKREGTYLFVELAEEQTIQIHQAMRVNGNRVIPGEVICANGLFYRVMTIFQHGYGGYKLQPFCSLLKLVNVFTSRSSTSRRGRRSAYPAELTLHDDFNIHMFEAELDSEGDAMECVVPLKEVQYNITSIRQSRKNDYYHPGNSGWTAYFLFPDLLQYSLNREKLGISDEAWDT